MHKWILGLVAAGMLGGCQTTNKIDLATYAPVIDLKAQNKEKQIYLADLKDCRVIGNKVQKTYEEQRKKEQERAMAAAIFGAFAGAALADTTARQNNYHTGNAVASGALTGLAIGAAVGANQVDYSRIMAKFGPTAVVDRCMVGRGYKILSPEGFGGG